MTDSHTLVVDGVSLGYGDRAVVHGLDLDVPPGRITCIVGANALVTEGKEFPDDSLIVGSPAKAVRTLDAENAARLRASAEHYVANAARFRKGLRRVDQSG